MIPFLSFSQRGVAKAKSAMESARVRQTKLVSMQKTENTAVADFPDWSPPSESRPSSGM